MIKTFSFFCLLLFTGNLCSGQELLFHKNRHREAIYEKGDIISFRVRGEDFTITDEIRGFTDSTIVFKDYMINPKEITRLYFDNKTRSWFIFRTKYSRLFIIAGLGYGLVDVLNTGEFDKQTMIISGSLIAAGLLAKFLIPGYFRIRGTKKLIIINIVPEYR